MPSSIRRHHLSSAPILCVSVLDITQQSEPYRNIGRMLMLYSFNFVEMASCDLQIWFSKLCMAADVTSASGWWVDKRAKVDKLLDYHDVLDLNLDG